MKKISVVHFQPSLKTLSRWRKLYELYCPQTSNQYFRVLKFCIFSIIIMFKTTLSAIMILLIGFVSFYVIIINFVMESQMILDVQNIYLFHYNFVKIVFFLIFKNLNIFTLKTKIIQLHIIIHNNFNSSLYNKEIRSHLSL